MIFDIIAKPLYISPLRRLSFLLKLHCLYFNVVFPLHGCLPPFLTLAEMLEMEGGKKTPNLSKFDFFEVLVSVLGSELIGQNRI